MAVTKVQIRGRVLLPDGTAPESGKIIVRLNRSGRTLDGAEVVDVTGEVSVTLDADGALPTTGVVLDLVPNDLITPTGTYYVATYVLRLPTGKSHTPAEKWQLASSPSPIDLGAVPRIDEATAAAYTTLEAVQAGVLASASASAAAAAASQLAAAASESAAATSEDAATAARIASEAARDAAAVAGNVFADTTAGVAGTAAGEYFVVPTTGNDALILYLNVDDTVGNVSEKARFPATAVVNALTAGFLPTVTDAAGNLHVMADRDARVYAYWDGGAQLYLTGDARSVQAVMATLQQGASTSTDLEQAATVDGLLYRRTDSFGAQVLPGMTESVQAAAWRARAGVPSGQWTSLPGGFTPFATPYEGQERYLWGGMPAALRPNVTQWVGFPFSWPTVSTFVDPSMVRRRVAAYTWPAGRETGTLSALTVNLPVGYAGVYQWRDLSVMYDRKLGKWFACLNSIGTYASGFLTDRFAIFESTDSLTWDFTAYVVPGQVAAGTAKVWSPEWFIDDDGTVYVIVGLNTGNDLQSYHLMRCTDTATFTAWTYHGKITGSSLPTNAAGGYAMNDPYLFKRDGVYYLAWSAMSNATSVAGYQLGLAYATSLLGPYDMGHSFIDNTGQAIKGEGQSIVELPPGSPRRFRLFWFNVGGQTYNGRSAVSMASPCVDSDDLVTFETITTHGTDATYFQHNTAVLGA